MRHRVVTNERYESAQGFVAAFAAAVGAPVAETYTPAENPYKGLQAFGEADAADFYGRDALVDELVRAVGERRLVAVVGPSGIGKSSVVKAGLVPALRGGGPVGSGRWLVTDMFPGSYPYEDSLPRSSGSQWNGRTTSSSSWRATSSGSVAS